MARIIQIVLVLLIAATVSFSRCEAGGWPNPKPQNPAYQTPRGNTAFALDMYSKLKAEKGNLFFSPYSISSALAMTYGGARGTTAAEMEKTLHFTQRQQVHEDFAWLNQELAAAQKDGGVELAIANSLWPQKSELFRPEFLEMTQKYYKSPVTPLDYNNPAQAVRTINSWVADNTKQKIQNLIDGLDRETVMVLVNAIYFKGKWAEPFKKEMTRDGDFTLASGEKTTVPMMHQTKKFAYSETDAMQILEMPYVGNRTSMVVILPRDPAGIAKIEDQLETQTLARWTSWLNSPREVIVTLPKFKMTWGTFDLKPAFENLGMHAPFSGTNADFSGMKEMKGTLDRIVISKILHKAFVEVNEEGTEAAAATAVIMVRGGIGPTIPSFNADHPFIFLIRDKTTGSILFIGKVMDPTK